MELNLLSFIPLIARKQNIQETEAAVKYFIIQAVGRGLILTAGIMSVTISPAQTYYTTINLIFILRMLIKLGVAPCHQWLPRVIARLNWPICLLLATWQKLSPLIILRVLAPRNIPALITFIAVLRAIIGGIGGVNQAQLRPLLAYSSIGHIGWIIIAIEIEITLLLLYLAVYITITFSLILLIIQTNKINSNFDNSLLPISTPIFLILITIIFRLGGLPPLLGFAPKWFIISILTAKHIFITILILICGRLINLFYYFNISFNFIILTKTPKKSTPYIPTSVIFSTIICTIAPIILYL